MGKAVMISSHILPELEDLSTDVGIIHQGRMVASGPVESIRDQLGASRVVEVRTMDRTEETGAILNKQRGIRDVEILHGQNMVRGVFKGSDAEQAAVLSALVEAGIPVVSFNSLQGLEDLFMAVTVEEDKP